MGAFMSKWYNEGLPSTPPPCLYSKTCYKMFSENYYCIKIGRMGTEWGEKNRSQIMFFAFWVSFVSWILLGACLACISTDATNVKTVPFFQGTITYTDPTTSVSSDFDFYAGLNKVVIEGCDLGAACPPHTQSWTSVSCDTYFNNCDECGDASIGSVTMVIMSFVTQFPQLTGNLGRSMAKYDLHCQKTMGIFTGVMGFLSTLAALNSFADTCFRNLSPAVSSLSLTKHAGAAFILLLVATILKAVDIWAHVIVPVPEQDYWTPSSAAEDDGGDSKVRKLIDPASGSSSV